MRFMCHFSLLTGLSYNENWIRASSEKHPLKHVFYFKLREGRGNVAPKIKIRQCFNKIRIFLNVCFITRAKKKHLIVGLLSFNRY